MFVPLVQHASNDGAVLVVRSTASPAAVMPAVRRAVAALDARVAIARVETMDDVLATSLAQPLRLRFFLGVFAALALALGTIGVYGVVSYAVARRRAEFAIRLALGASPARLRQEVVRLALVPVLIGVVGGLLASQAFAGLLRRFLYGLGATDPASLGIAAGALLLAGALAALIPAVRAGRTSPVEVLRAE
jgi:ABC-type antimicrobial peptide transport system permease subunit